MSIKIEAGKFYRNGYGERRGPMRSYYGVSYPWTDGVAVYTDDGGYWNHGSHSQRDLIAEWTDEPATITAQCKERMEHHMSQGQYARAVKWAHIAEQVEALEAESNE